MPTTRRAAVATILASVAAVFLLDAALFRTRLYLDYLHPESSTGLFEMRYQLERDRAREPGNLIVTVGDSRFSYLPRIANQYTSQSGYVFRHAGMAGTSPRDWYYMLRDLDPTARRFQAVVISFENLEDEDSLVDRADDPRSLHYVIGRLRLSDAWDFAMSHHEFSFRWTALRGAILKGTAMQTDIHDFLLQPRERIALVKLYRKGYAGWTYDYDEEERSMAGVTVDWKTRQVTLPPGSEPTYRQIFDQTLLRKPAPPNGMVREYSLQWIGRIIDRYRDSPTRIVFIRLPRGPIPPLADVPLNPQSSVRQFAKRPRVYLGDPMRYAELERPELFKDPLHLNRPGAYAFSKMLVDEVTDLIGPPH